MGADIPNVSRETFEAAIQACSPVVLAGTAVEALWVHFQELRRWNRRLSLIGKGTVHDLVSRHYGESLAALPWLDDATTLLDIGSGGGFPGWVIAAARPDLRVYLAEVREKKWAFLKAAARRAELSLFCINAKVGSPQAAGYPDDVDVVTCRAVKITPDLVQPFVEEETRLLLWQGDESATPLEAWSIRRQMQLAGGDRRRLLELQSMDRLGTDRRTGVQGNSTDVSK
ncbi:MAG: RsmG family class I SAM-dependent methyltransferase [Acidobacteriota bacterium]